MNNKEQERHDKEEAAKQKQAEKRRELEATKLKKRIAEQQKATETSAHATPVPSPSRLRPPAEAATKDLLSWVVKATRSWLQLVLILWWAGCFGGLFITGLGLHRSIPVLASSDPQATATDYIMVVAAAVFAVSFWLLMMALGTVFVGLAGVLFEIERNTRR